jgi:hypothetical protein
VGDAVRARAPGVRVRHARGEPPTMTVGRTPSSARSVQLTGPKAEDMTIRSCCSHMAWNGGGTRVQS